MKKINIAHVPVVGDQSPGGKYASTIQEISIALGHQPCSLDLAKRHPFDLRSSVSRRVSRFAPTIATGPNPSFTWSFSGRGSVRDQHGTTEVSAGDTFFFAPGEAHQISNPGSEDFAYYVIADNPRHDSCYYPDSGKWAVTKESPDYVTIQGTEANYYKDEE